MDAFGRIFEIIVTVFFLFLVPLQITAQKQDQLNQTYVMTETSRLVDSVRNLGYLTKNMYEAYLTRLKAAGHVFQVELTSYRGEAAAGENADYTWHYFGSYTGQILGAVYGEEKMGYRFHQGDFFSMKVWNQDKTLASRMLQFFTGNTGGGPEIMVIYGGAIRDEAY